MTGRMVWDEQSLWRLDPGTRFREIGRLGREFIVDDHRAGVLWHGPTPCPVAVVELPVEVVTRAV
ncbi:MULTISPECIES: hypothetical protein [unclassified Rhodococcus (in: high G+C Gram-positive bacteria)]|uniref:hypothetical protein n=1 Tax=unclassified Rhodococcus (in: high G+C Gram-positive bacteria) TaxID=192944 RepID=UPI000B9B8536|nr:MULTISPECIES: hypothetical protein [unclassified Rhodococcus (in: high G+C Gram-positive bacteria)]OZE35654.1 hypothetical protein CH259_16655 [Rhodococcus sp. 05-2254-4]OZE48083.1 hypothetical protein CH261_09250 [Rhodococcus sp. 05-2254-3]OZE49294.1 hypothetical protein CH283_17035 [Rhodococcus sp. 05-2254-2]